MNDTVIACSECGSIQPTHECDFDDYEFIEMPNKTAARLRFLTESCIRSGAFGDTTVRIYRHSGVHFGGYGTDSLVNFSHEIWPHVVALVERKDDE
jgi:hypothetical protein